jgi:hypothetical protein
MRATRMVIFAKAPVPGRVKTCLVPALGEVRAAQLALEMLQATIADAHAAGFGTPELCASPHPEDPSWQPFLPAAQVGFAGQGKGDLGERLARAAPRVSSTWGKTLCLSVPVARRSTAISCARRLRHRRLETQ